MNLLWVLVIVLLVVVLMGAPNIGVFNHSYGWGPSGVGLLIVVILIVLLISGRL